MKKLSFIALFLAFVGCADVLSPEAQRIVLVSEKPLDCAFLGNESGQVVDTSGAMSDNALKRSTENDLRIKSAKLGGDTLHILGVEKNWNDLWGGYEQIIKGEVYKCTKDLGESSAVNSVDLSESDK